MAKVSRVEILLSTSADSKTQTDSPSGPVSFHQRSPQSRRPETFFTVQKSNAKRSTIITKRRTLCSLHFDRSRKGSYKLSVNSIPSRYVNNAATSSVTNGACTNLFGTQGRRRALKDVLRF